MTLQHQKPINYHLGSFIALSNLLTLSLKNRSFLEEPLIGFVSTQKRLAPQHCMPDNTSYLPAASCWENLTLSLVRLPPVDLKQNKELASLV